MQSPFFVYKDMKKKIFIMLLLVCAGCGIWLATTRSRSNDVLRNDGLSHGINPVDSSNVPATNETARVKARLLGPVHEVQEHKAVLLKGRQPGVVVAMSPEMATEIEEMLNVTSNLNSLVGIGDHERLLLEARRLAQHPNREVRLASLEAMDWIGTDAVVDLAFFFDDSDDGIRASATEVLLDMVDDQEDPLLKIKLLEIPLSSLYADVRMEALDALAFLPEQLSFPLMASMLGDADPQLRNSVKDHLRFISSEWFENEGQAMSWYGLHKDELEDAGFLKM